MSAPQVPGRHHDSARPREPRLLAWLARRLVRGPHASFVIDDLAELYVRDLDRGASRWRARSAYARNLLASAWKVARARVRPRLARSFGVSWLDFVVGARMLARYPGLTVVGGLGIAVTIAIGVASFTFFYANLYPVIPLEEGDRLVGLENWDLRANNEWRRQVHDYVEWRESMTTISEFGAFRVVGADLVGGASTERVRIAQTTASAFRMARVAPHLGRYLVDDDEAEGAAPVLVIGHDVWRAQFAADPDIVGREVRLGRTPHTIVGVMPDGYGFPWAESLWTPLRIDPSGSERGEGPVIYIFGRLAPGATAEQAQAELTAIGARAAERFPETHAELRPLVHPYTYPLVDIQGIGLLEVGIMQTIVALLLVVVAVNVAVLTYARTATRATELSVRSALGASRGRLIAQFLAEALVFTLVSAALGLAIARVFIREVNRVMELDFGGGSPFWADYSLPPAAWLYTVGLVALTVLLIGGLPTLRATGRDLRTRLSHLGGTASMRFGRAWTALIVVQVAITVGGLPVVMSMGWTVVGSVATRSAFVAQELLSTRVTMQMDFPPLPDSEAREVYAGPYRARVADVMQALRERPDVSHVSIATGYPGQEPVRTFELEGGGPETGMEMESAATFDARATSVGLRFFAALDAPILAGRELDDRDLADATGAVVVNESFVRRVLDGRPAVGRRVRYVGRNRRPPATDRWHEIVGVIADLHVNRADPEWVRPTLYHPLDVAEVGYPARLIVRLPGDALAAGTATAEARLQDVTASVDPTLRLVGTQTLDQVSRQEQLAVTLTLVALLLVTGSVLLLSAAGVYAMMSFTVTRRRREIGIRSALGGRPGRILRAVFGDALRQLTIGVVVGVVFAAALDGLAEGQIIGDKGFALVPITSLILLLAGALAAYGPARRGLRIQPTDALREP